MRLAPRLERLTWYGHGPQENYPDRLAAAPVGVWKNAVTDQAFPYPRPQETGNHEGVRWLRLADDSGRGWLVVAEGSPIAASALHYTAEQLAAAKHTTDLTPLDEVVLSLDARHCGLGNSSCGPGVLAKYAVPVQNYEMQLRFEPTGPGDNPAEQARFRYPVRTQ
jgi:beta-galactosidase